MRTALPGISQVASLPSCPFRSCLLMFALFAWEERRLAACPPRFRVAAAVFPRNLLRSSLACAGLLSEPYLGPRFVRGSNHGSPYIVHVGFFLGGSAFGGSGKGVASFVVHAVFVIAYAVLRIWKAVRDKRAHEQSGAVESVQ